MNLNHATNKENGSTLSATEWNSLAADVNELGAGGVSGSSDPHIVFDERSASNPTGKSNLTIETTASDQYQDGSKTKGGKINIEPISDLQIKPGDDIAFYAHHREEGSKDAILMKVLTETNAEAEIPAQLKINSGDITLTSKDNVSSFMLEIKPTYKNTPDFVIDADFPANTFINGYIYKSTDLMNTFSSFLSTINVLEGDGTTTSSWATLIVSFNDAGVNKTRVIKYTDGTTTKFYKFKRIANDPGITNINVQGASGKGYLKVRAQAIDLRCEDHGGIALQPKGEDGQGNMNKIKFEHGGGDGLEFGTFNTEHTSIYTGDYRFKKDGVIKLANRFTEVSDKADASDSTTAYKYLKNNATNNAAKATSESTTFDAADDFYDFVDSSDPTCTWNDIIVAVNYIKSQNPSLGWTQPASNL